MRASPKGDASERAMPRSTLGLELLVDHRLERLRGLGAPQLRTVDGEGGGAGGSERRAFLGVRVDLVLELPRVERLLELAHVEAELLRVLLEGGAVEGLLVGEQLVVVGPELPLLVRGQ